MTDPCQCFCTKNSEKIKAYRIEFSKTNFGFAMQPAQTEFLALQQRVVVVAAVQAKQACLKRSMPTSTLELWYYALAIFKAKKPCNCCLHAAFQAIFFIGFNCDSSFRPIVFWRRLWAWRAWRSSSKLSAYVSLKQLEINKKWAKKTTFSDDENFGTVRRVPRQRPAPRRRLLHNVLR